MNNNFDVIILGSGLAGSILATILARHHLQVLMIDKEVHPRFAIGEAMIPDTDLMMKILSYQYSVPEIEYLSSFQNICKNISPSSCGIKRSFSFIYHQEGEKQNLQQSNKIGVYPSSHLFRQDIDYYMAKVAVKYGVKLLENTNVINININKESVEIEVAENEVFTAKYLVDGSGYKSPLSQKLDVRENPTRLKTHSRSIFTHMVQVERYDDCVPSLEQKQDGLFWYQGTLHHIFDGGWMWVIPFNNHQKSTNPVCSVGLNLDPRRFPNNQTPPEEEFKNFLSRFPEIAIQFKNAKPVRKWVSTGRLQYSSRLCMGERFYLLPHAAGFIDPLYSFGLVNSCTMIIPLASRIMNAISENNYSTEYFIDLEQLQQKLFDYNDNLVNCSYIAFRNFNLWNAWRRVWIIGNSLRQWKLSVKKGRKIDAGKGEELSKIIDEDSLDYLTPGYDGLGDDFFQEATTTVEKVEQNLISPDAAAEHIMSLINSIDFLPTNYLGLGNPWETNIDIASNFAAVEHRRFLDWAKSSQKPEVKKYFDYNPEDVLSKSK